MFLCSQLVWLIVQSVDVTYCAVSSYDLSPSSHPSSDAVPTGETTFPHGMYQQVNHVKAVGACFTIEIRIL